MASSFFHTCTIEEVFHRNSPFDQVLCAIGLNLCNVLQYLQYHNPRYYIGYLWHSCWRLHFDLKLGIQINGKGCILFFHFGSGIIIANICVQCLNALHFIGCQGKVKDVRILPDDLWEINLSTMLLLPSYCLGKSIENE